MRHTRRKWRLLPAGDRAWRQLTAAAERAGIGQRPSETIYEYAGWLEEQLPRHGEPIHVVADGKVWHAYSGRRLTATSNLKLEAALRALSDPDAEPHRQALHAPALQARLEGLTRRPARHSASG